MLLLGGKEYVGIMHLHGAVSSETLEKTIKSFTGKITQLPPVRSNVKRALREREVFYLDILEVMDKDVLFKTGVQSGTYIRKLVHDIGQTLGTGAHMSELRRTKVCSLKESDRLVTLQDIDDAVFYYVNENDGKFLNYCVQNIESAIDFMPKVFLSDYAVDTICHGSPVAVPGIVKFNDFSKNEKIALLSLKGELVAIGDSIVESQNLYGMEKGIVVKTDSVVMPIGTYPKYEREKV